MRARSVAFQALLNAYWIPLNFQTTALMTIAVPVAILRFPTVDKVSELALLATLVAVISMAAMPLAGEISDRWRARGTSRSPFIVGGAAVNAASLVWMMTAPTPTVFAIAVAFATLGQSASQAAYSALIPEAVPREHWGLASAYQGVGTLIGSIAGLVTAGALGDTGANSALAICAVLIVVGALTVLPVRDQRFVDAGRAEVRHARDFAIAFASRCFTLFGMMLLNTFIVYFFQDVLKLSNYTLGTALAGVVTMVGALVSAIVLGVLSDRFERKHVVALAGVPMAMAAIGFGILPELKWILLFAVLFGLGYGGIISAGWALAIDSVPELGNVARFLGIWGIASNLPAIFAPEAGNWILHTFHGDLDGYPALFIASGVSFLMGSAVVLFTRNRR
jgi:MFS family permease